MKQIYDIRTSERALKTLIELTGVDKCIWKKYIGHEREYRYTDDLVLDVAKSFGRIPKHYCDLEFIYFHVTTSANECSAFRKYGIFDLQKAYLCQESELRSFLDEHGVEINLNEKMLIYRGKQHDISYNAGTYTRFETPEHYCGSIGRKFYYDYTSCGFLSVWENSEYGGQVNWRPEILSDIDSLLHLKLSYKWAETHMPFEIVAKIDGNGIVYDGDDNQTEEEKVANYLTKAYDMAFAEPFEHILLLKNHVQIPPSDIIEIKPLTHWQRC